jgi:hypothetical protein
MEILVTLEYLSANVICGQSNQYSIAHSSRPAFSRIHLIGENRRTDYNFPCKPCRRRKYFGCFTKHVLVCDFSQAIKTLP